MKLKSLVAVLTVSLAVSALADKVTLKSGSFLTGSAGKMTDNVLEFKSDDLGDMKIDVSKIAAIESSGEHIIEYKDLSRETKPITVRDGEYYIADQKLDMSNIKAIDPAVETWHGSVNFTWESDRGNTYKNSATVLANVNRRWEEDRFTANFAYNYSETGTSKRDRETSERNWEIDGQHDHFWLPKAYTYESAKYEQDDIAGIDYRLRLGVGAGYQWLEKSKFDTFGTVSFNQEAGLAWVKTDFHVEDPDAESSYASFRYAHHFTYLPKWYEGVEVFHNLEYLPQIDDWENYLIEADVGISTKIFGNFDLLAKIEWDYNSRPSVGNKSSDFKYIVGLGYKW